MTEETKPRNWQTIKEYTDYFEVTAQVFQHQCPDIVAKTHITGKQQHRAFCSTYFSISTTALPA